MTIAIGMGERLGVGVVGVLIVGQVGIGDRGQVPQAVVVELGDPVEPVDRDDRQAVGVLMSLAVTLP